MAGRTPSRPPAIAGQAAVMSYEPQDAQVDRLARDKRKGARMQTHRPVSIIPAILQYESYAMLCYTATN